MKKFNGFRPSENDICHYFSPECEGETKADCRYWDGKCICPMSKDEVMK